MRGLLKKTKTKTKFVFSLNYGLSQSVFSWSMALLKKVYIGGKAL